MRKSFIISILVAACLIASVTPITPLGSAFVIDDDAPSVAKEDGDARPSSFADNERSDESSASEDDSYAQFPTEKKKGNRFVRAIKAPFKAIGKLFGGGKDDDGKLRRLRRKDVEKFESAAVVRVRDAETARPAPVPDEMRNARELLRRGEKALIDGHVNAAIDMLSQAASLDPELAKAHNLLGVAFGRKNLHQFALRSFEAALRIDRKDGDTLNNYGYELYRVGEYDKAVKYLKRSVKYAPRDGRAWNNLALAQCRVGKYDDAFKSFRRAGGEFNGHINVASVLERMGYAERAIKHYEAARRERPRSAFVLARLAELYRRIGEREKYEEARLALAGPNSKPNVAGEERTTKEK